MQGQGFLAGLGRRPTGGSSDPQIARALLQGEHDNTRDRMGAAPFLATGMAGQTWRGSPGGEDGLWCNKRPQLDASGRAGVGAEVRSMGGARHNLV